MKKYSFPKLGAVISLIPFAFALWARNRVTDPMVTHWDVHGVPDGYSSTFVGLWLLPLIILGIYLLFLVIPYIDPKAKNIEQFKSSWYLFVGGLQAFLVTFYIGSILWNTGHTFNVGKWMSVMFCLLFLLVARLLSVAKQNYFIGIRTPWTLASEPVWNKTHQLGSKVFTVIGAAALLGLIRPVYGFVAIVGGTAAAVFGLLIYSYYLYRNQKS